MTPDERNLRRHRITCALFANDQADHMTAGELKALVIDIDAAIDSPNMDGMAPLPEAWSDNCVVGEQCTGFNADWCPNCGQCSCPDPEHRGVSIHPDCPLHEMDTKHEGGWHDAVPTVRSEQDGGQR